MKLFEPIMMGSCWSFTTVKATFSSTSSPICSDSMYRTEPSMMYPVSGTIAAAPFSKSAMVMMWSFKNFMACS